MRLFKKSPTSKRSKKQNSEVISQMKSIIHKIETGQMSVRTYGSWPGAVDEFNFKIVLVSAEIPKLSEDLEK